ncbi:hypothetical protein [Streptomyces sp. RPT161]|uniref:hypothetical protein n=1 Tax=Streptomyces sp. RPT161 TaxID=3015993 RepID=UPI0022B8C8E8|nr:hypothetical protein [Streptomyces sp. RPT161]
MRLKKMAYGHKTEHRLRVRVQAVLHAAHGRSNGFIAREKGLHLDTVRRRPGRFFHAGLPGSKTVNAYIRTWQGEQLGDDEFVISADEKTSIQALCRCHPTLACRQGQGDARQSHYGRGGALAYLAAYDVHAAMAFGRTPTDNARSAAWLSPSPRQCRLVLSSSSGLWRRCWGAVAGRHRRVRLRGLSSV